MIISSKTIDGTPVKDLGKNSNKKVQVECEKCGIQRWVQYGNINRKFLATNSKETLCKKCATVGNKWAEGKVPWNKGKSYFNGKDHPQWKGGKWVSSDGYVMVYNPENSDLKVGWNKYKKEHILKMENKLKRKLNKNEVVHHIDGNKLNNKLSNLCLIDSHKTHRFSHASLQSIGYELVKLGYIKFDKKSLAYKADQKLRELLEHPEEDHQQPSLSSNTFEGSETSSESLIGQ